MRGQGVIAAIVLLALPAAAAQALGPNATILVDRPSGNAALPYDGAGRGFIESKAISANGCFVLFVADSDPLFAGDDNMGRNLYRLSRCGGPTLVQVNTSDTGIPAEGLTTNALSSISADGTRVAFQSNAKTLEPGADGSDQIYVKDLTTGALELVSRGNGPTGTPVAYVGPAVISGDGQHVAFMASGVIDADNVDGVVGSFDVFERNMVANTTHMVSVSATDTPGGGLAYLKPGISNNGAVVSFTSSSQLAAGDTDTSHDAYVRQGLNGGAEVTRLVSFNVGQTPGADASFSQTDVADDGLQVAWTKSQAWMTTCNPACAVAAKQDVAVAGGSDQPASATDASFPRTGTAAPSRVLFRTSAPLVPADTAGKLDLYSRTISSPATALLTDGALAEGIFAGDASDNAAVVGFGTDTPELPASGGFLPQAYVRTLPGGTTTLISAPPQVDDAGDADIGRRSVSADGRFVVFESRAPAFGGGPRNGNLFEQVLLRDNVSGTTTLMSTAPDGTPGDRRSFLAGIDGAGDKVVFVSAADNLPGADGSHRKHVYVRDVASGAVRMLDVVAPGTPANSDGYEAQISADGKWAVFVSAATDLPASPAGALNHAYLIDLATGDMRLVDRATNGAVANSNAGDVDISADGSRVAFQTDASNLGIANGGSEHVFVRDVANSTLIWVSVPEDGNPTHAMAHLPFLDATGHKVAFTNNGAAFGYGAADDTRVFLRDLDAGTTTNQSIAGDYADTPVLSADASKLALTGGPYNAPQAYVRDVATGTTVLAGARDGTDSPPRGASYHVALSATGACAVFMAASDDIVPGTYGPDLTHIFLHALSADCLPSPAPAPGGQGSDTTAPVVTRLAMTNRRFAVAKGHTAATAKKAKKGTAFRFTLSESATTRIVIARKSAGRRKGKRCVKPTAKLRKARRCTRFITAATLRRSKTRQGANKVAYSGRIEKRSLPPGSYRATLTATDPAGNRSVARSISFKVVRR
jgi:Tol biopolymer transport system component